MCAVTVYFNFNNHGGNSAVKIQQTAYKAPVPLGYRHGLFLMLRTRTWQDCTLGPDVKQPEPAGGPAVRDPMTTQPDNDTCLTQCSWECVHRTDGLVQYGFAGHYEY